MNCDSDEELVFTKKKKYIVESDEESTQENSSCVPADDSPSKKGGQITVCEESHVEGSNEDSLKNTTSCSQITSEQNDMNESYQERAADDEEYSTKSRKSWYKNDDLFGDDSSEDERDKQDEDKNGSDGEQSECDDTGIPESSPVIHMERKERKSKTKAQDEIKEIRRESQRKMREAQTSLPYHRPRHRTLAEFLNRKKAPATIPLVHASEEVLRSAWNTIEEREKEVEMFYKSESSDEESESEQDKKIQIDKEKDLTSEIGNVPSLDNILVSVEKENKDVNQIGTEEKNESCKRNLMSSFATNIAEDVLLNDIERNNKLSSCEADQNSIEIKLNDDAESHKSNTETLDSTESSTCESKQNFVSVDCDSDSGLLCSSNLIGQASNNSKGPSNTIVDESDSSKASQVLDNKSHHSDTTSIINTEDFSLRYSESQGELDLLKEEDKSSLKKPDECEETSEILKQNQPQFEKKSELSDLLGESDLISNENKDLSNGIDSNQDKLEEKASKEIESLEDKLLKKYNIDFKQPILEFPKLSGTPDTVIDLDEEINKPGANRLMDRFMKHLSYKKKPVKQKKPVEVSIVSEEKDDSGRLTGIREETVRLLVGEGDEDEGDPELARPGARMARLRAQLQLEMGRKREQEWARKQQEQRLYEQEMFDEEKEITDDEGDSPKKRGKEGYENEAHCSESDDEESEEEEDEDVEEQDCEDKPTKKKNAFVDDEAEESDDGFNENDDESCSDTFIKKPSHARGLFQRQSREDLFASQELIKNPISDLIEEEEEEVTSFQKPRAPEEKEEDIDDLTSQSSVCQSPAFHLTALEGKDIHSFNWSEPTTPCKDLISPKTVTPIRARIANLVDKSPLIGSQDLENMCSGQFVTQLETLETTADDDNDSQDFQLFLDESQQSECETPKRASSLAKKEKSILDEHSGMRSFHEDGDAGDEEINTKINNRKVKRLNFSDDEDEGENEADKAEESKPEENLQENELKEKLEESDSEENQEVGELEYDSEENEVVRTAGDFLEKEAELSEEEWESEDEDEQGLDTLEMEEADRENIDQRRMQREHEQLLMKQTIAEDKMRVRLLQERFLEDGELHTEAKRQRLFRWSNNAFNEDDNKAQIDSDGEKDDDEEDEENWRRSRHEREQFLIEHKKEFEKMDLEIEESDSQLLKLGHKALKRLNSSNDAKDQGPPLSASIASPNPKKPYGGFSVVTRGSFLTRSSQVLSKLAQITSASEGPINQPKNSRNFVFTAISPTKEAETEDARPRQISSKRKVPSIVLPEPKRPCALRPKIANNKSIFEALAKVKS